jgi:hypothetical protein
VSRLRIDHLVVAAASLEQGVLWCESMLGVRPSPGGRHALMGTHNRLLDLSGDRFERVYLEIIATDPEAPALGRPRWFGLDDAALQRRLAKAPQLVHWVARTTALDADRRAFIDAGCSPGDAVRATRDALSWRIVLRGDGSLEAGGAVPTLIEWDAAHPCDGLAASGVTLQALTLRGLWPSVQALIAASGVGTLAGSGPALRATLATPRGEVNLKSA